MPIGFHWVNIFPRKCIYKHEPKQGEDKSSRYYTPCTLDNLFPLHGRSDFNPRLQLLAACGVITESDARFETIIYFMYVVYSLLRCYFQSIRHYKGGKR